MTSLEGKVAVITGSTRGIGRAVAEALLEAGARVTISSRKAPAVEAAGQELGATFGEDRVLAMVANAGDPEQARACVEATVGRFGAVDILVNNAATNPYFGPLMELDVARAEKTVAVNQLGPLLWTQLAWELSMAARGGAVVNVASIGAQRVERGFAYYNVTKAALVHLTHHLASELAPTVRVNAVAPGVVRTDLSKALWQHGDGAVAGHIPLGRIGEPVDIARAVRFLASAEASWITGQTLVVDGGSMVEESPLAFPT
jgi:NAD(P)-dependent dehydrogenase (short-subunit alcohol dehydrogenase family)